MGFRYLRAHEIGLMSTDEVDKYIGAKRAYEAGLKKALGNGAELHYSHAAEVDTFWGVDEPIAKSGNGKATETLKGPSEEETRRASVIPPHPGENPTAPSEPVIEMASDITPEKIDWLWRDFLARGMLHIFAGAPETGKTTLALSYAAIISAGQHWPDGVKATIGKVLIWTNEDDDAKTIIPRLIRMGAETKNIGIIRGQLENGHKRPFNPAIDMPSLIAKAKEIGGVDLLILDPVVAAVPLSRNSHNNSETRLGRLVCVCRASSACSAFAVDGRTKPYRRCGFSSKR
jgi:AAA domain